MNAPAPVTSPTGPPASFLQPGAGGGAWFPAAVLALLVAALLGRSFLSMAAQWWSSSTYSYGFLILPVALFVAWRRRAALAAVPVRPAWIPVLLALPVALAWALGQMLGLDVVHQGAAVALVVLTVWATLGTAVARVLWFPLAYLFLMVPFGEFLVPWLMQLTADATVLGVRASGVPVFQDGYVFSLPSGDFEVIKACSGIRFLMATLAAGAVFAYVAFQSWRRRLMFMGLCLVVPVIANLVRAYGVVMLVHLSDMRFAAGGDHIFYGTIFFGAVLIGMFIVAARWAEPEALPAVAGVAVPEDGRGIRWSGLLAGGALVALCVAALAAPALLRTAAGTVAPSPLAGLPLATGGWEGPLVATEAWEPAFPGALREDQGRYRDSGAGSVVDAYVVSFGPASGRGDLASSANSLYRVEVWRPASPAGATGSLDGRPYGELLLRGPGDTGRLVWFWYRVQGERTLSRARVKALELMAILRGQSLEAGLVAISAPFEDDHDAARTRLAGFVAAVCAGHADCVLAP